MPDTFRAVSGTARQVSGTRFEYAVLMSRVSELPSPWCAPMPLPIACRTERLRLRFWQPADAPAMFHALSIDRASFLPWLPFIKSDNRTVEECEASIVRFQERRTQVAPPPSDFVIGIFDVASGEAVGSTGLHRIVHAWHEAEIGYWIRADRRRQGLCKEAVAALVTWAFRAPTDGGWGLRRIHIRCAAANVSSSRVPVKLGFVHEATLRRERWIDGIGWDDTLVYGMLRDEWRGEPKDFTVEHEASWARR